MLAKLTHLLTLFAFAAHAVFGCCGHHEHGDHGICGSHAGALLAGHPSDLSARIEHEHSPESACGEHESRVARNLFRASQNLGESSRDRSSPVSLVSNDDGSHRPCERPHNCNGVSCTYITNGWSTVDRNSQSDFLGVAPLGSLLLGFGAVEDQHQDRLCVSNLGCTSTTRCAFLQSWQI